MPTFFDIFKLGGLTVDSIKCKAIDAAMETFEKGDIVLGTEYLLKAYYESNKSKEILAYFDEIFFKPNLMELERIYNLNVDKINIELNQSMIDFKDLPYFVIPIEENLFYIYDKESSNIIDKDFTKEQLSVIELCTVENVDITIANRAKYLEGFFEKFNKNELNETRTKLHVGCGRNILEGWINLDIVALPGVDIVADLDYCKKNKLPLKNDSIDEFYVSHVIEHIRNPLDMMEELHRVAMPNAKAIFRCPYGSSDEAFEDPTHVRQYFVSSFGYFSQPFYWRADYGYRGDWEVEKIILTVDKIRNKDKNIKKIFEEINLYRNMVIEMTVELRAIKPIREPKLELQTNPKIEIKLL